MLTLDHYLRITESVIQVQPAYLVTSHDGVYFVVDTENDARYFVNGIPDYANASLSSGFTSGPNDYTVSVDRCSDPLRISLWRLEPDCHKVGVVDVPGISTSRVWQIYILGCAGGRVYARYGEYVIVLRFGQ